MEGVWSHKEMFIQWMQALLGNWGSGVEIAKAIKFHHWSDDALMQDQLEDHDNGDWWSRKRVYSKPEISKVLCLRVTRHNRTLCKLATEYIIEFGISGWSSVVLKKVLRWKRVPSSWSGLHGGVSGSHLSNNKMLKKVSWRFYWVNSLADVQSLLQYVRCKWRSMTSIRN